MSDDLLIFFSVIQMLNLLMYLYVCLKEFDSVVIQRHDSDRIVILSYDG